MQLKRYRYTFLILSFVLVILAISGYFYFYLSTQNKKCVAETISFIESGMEVEPSFLIHPNGEIIISGNKSDLFSLYKYKNSKLSVYDSIPNVMYPFLFKGRVAGLTDQDGNEKFRSTDSNFNSYFGSNYIRSVFSFKKGLLLIVQLIDDNDIYIVDVLKQTKRILISNVKNLHNVQYSEEYNFMVANYDNKLLCIKLNDNKQRIEISSNSEGEKMNPFIYGKEIYFSNNIDSEYYSIYRVNIEDKPGVPEQLLQSAHDVKMPKYNGESLFYIEVINSEYLLRKMDLNSGTIYKITNNGVIYNYEFYDTKDIIFTFTDFDTPKSIISYNISDNSFNNLTGNSLKLNISYKFIEQTTERSPAYLYSPPNEVKIKGVILFFHPGLHSDFSPRWDPLLSNLCNNGYVILAPNYPMSAGFGKSFYNANFSDAVTDIAKWKNFIRDYYKEHPIYYLSTSSGNILMEHTLIEDNKNILASASFFGISSSSEYNSSIPTIYFLGRNDPIVGYSDLLNKLRKEQINNDNIKIVSYDAEGHWFRKSNNLKNAMQYLANFFCQHY